MENYLYEVLLQMIKSFVYKENREPKIIILDFNTWLKFIELNRNQYIHYNEKVVEGTFMMCKVISSVNVESIEIY